MTKKDKNKERPTREIDFELVAKIVLVLTIIGIIISTVLIFTPPVSGEEYAEMGILTFNSESGQYKADNYPTNTIYNQTLGYSNLITLYIHLANHYDSAKFFEIRLKIGLQSVLINEDVFGTNETTFFLEDYWLQRVLAEDDQFGPSNQTKFEFRFTSEIIDKLGLNDDGYKIIFELWEFDSGISEFVYTGVHTYLTSFQLVLVT